MTQEKDIIPTQKSSLEADTNQVLHDSTNFLALLPLKNVVILPRSIIPIIVGRASSIQAVEYALRTDKTIFITAQKDANVENPSLQDMYDFGTRSTILQVMRMPNGALRILAEGICRAQVVGIQPDQPFIGVYCQDIPTTSLYITTEIEAVWRQLKALYNSYTKLNEKAPADLPLTARTAQNMDYLVDTIAVHISNISFDDRQKFLETFDLKSRMMLLCNLLTKEIEILQTEQRIRGHVQTQVEKSQKEYYLTEQMKAIQKELGREDHALEVGTIRSSLKKLGLSKEAYEKVEKELKRLEQMPPLSSEAVVSRHYIDWVTGIPWKSVTTDTIGIEEAEQILHQQHAGLKKAKERIIEFLAAKKFSKKLERSPIICLVGPPGVGKTSLAQSIAKSLGREFIRISLGGVKDEAEIRGHRRTYIGALPGKIIQAMRKAKKMNPVILFDEIDKMSRDLHGDPASALLEVLDPEQNRSFTDHFLDVEYDLSKVMFIATANMIEGIPYPLLDRMELISLSGYTQDEKVAIAEKFLIPKNLKEYGLKPTQCIINTTLLHEIINEYTKEAGVRQLERLLTKLMRKTIQTLLKKPKEKKAVITPDLLKDWLGNPPFKKTSLNNAQERLGLATGLAWTEVGGDVLEIEASALAGKGNLTLTGQLGEVMQESAQAALSYIRARAKELGLAPSFYTTKDIHVHIPEGATPKDGPSAGITMCSALISVLTKNPTQHALAMTGEITLQGRVLSVGGLKEKLLAAQQHNIKKVIVPQENHDDIQEILKETTLNLELVYATTMDDVLQAAFVVPPFEHAKKLAAQTKEKTTTKRKKTKK
ncbi:MAG TPA: endopeptidase La [Candidatus Limnocylindria bacterium]|nr:endopeptidase La [Candidatus Limnocylindria bacterium]